MMFQLSVDVDNKQGTFTIHLPEGKTMEEINTIALEQLPAFVGKMQDYDIDVTGDCTIALAMLISYELSFACRSVRVFDPKENEFIKVFDIDDLKNSSETNVLLAIKKAKRRK